VIGHFAPILLLIISVMLFLPALLVARSPEVAGYEKVCWIAVSIFLSWAGLVIFLVEYSGRNAPNRG
jgi:hypothetical protein